MAMTEEQKLRTLIAYEAYQVWMSNKQIRPSDLCRRIAARIYGDMLLRAETDPHYRDLCEKLDIRPGVPRATENALSIIAASSTLNWEAA